MSGEDFAIMQIAICAFVALGAGVVFFRMKQPAILAYVLTGVILGPSCLGLIQAREQVELLAELGVLLLLFVLGMELNVQTFRKNIYISSLGVILQIIIGLAVSFVVALFFNWPLHLTFAFGCVFALSSTAVVVNTIEGMNMSKSSTSKIIIGILVAQDIAVIPMILILKFLVGTGNNFELISRVVASIMFMAMLIAFLNTKVVYNTNLDMKKIFGENKDLYMLAGLAICFAAAAISGGIGLTAPYGAFLAGLTLGNMSSNNNFFVDGIKPIQKLLMMIFFCSIGILLDVQFVFEHWFLIAILLIIVTVVKTLVNITILRILSLKLAQATFIGISLAQLGEFAFLLTTILDSECKTFEFAQKSLVSLTVLSLAFSPVWLKLGRKVNKLIKKRNDISPRSLIRYTILSSLREWYKTNKVIIQSKISKKRVKKKKSRI